jgi:hypothetical protein
MDHLAQNLKFDVLNFFGHGWLLGGRKAVLKLFLEFGCGDLLVVNTGNDVGGC